MLDGIVRLLSAKPEAASVAWCWDLDQSTVWVPMDRGQMEQALS